MNITHPPIIITVLGLGSVALAQPPKSDPTKSGDAQWTLVSVDGANDETHTRA